MGWKARVLTGIGVLAAAGAIDRAAAVRRRQETADTRQALHRVRTLYDHGAGRYDRAMNLLDRWLFAGSRRWVAGQAQGSVLEVAAGSGRNMRYYPATARVTAQDLSTVMLERARARAMAAGHHVNLQAGDAQALAFRDGSFDTVVCTLGLCTIPDERRALQEAWRVLKPGGLLLLLEHVRSSRPVVSAVQRLLDPLACLLASDHLRRDPLPVAAATGFEILCVERLVLDIVERVVARKPLSTSW